MKIKTFSSIIAAAAVAAPFVSSATEFQSRRNRAVEANPDYVLKLGELRIDAAYNAYLQHDSNTNRTGDPSEKESATYLFNGLNLKTFWPITPGYTFDMKFNLGWKQDISGDGTNGITLDLVDRETIALDITIGERGMLSFIDTFWIDYETVNFGGGNNTEDFRELTNDFAMQFEYDLSAIYSLNTRVGRKDIVNLGDSDFDHREMSTEYATAFFRWQANESFGFGPYTSYRSHSWKEDLTDSTIRNNDGTETEFGIQADAMVGAATTVKATLGYQRMRFEDSNVSIDDEDGGFAGSLQLANQASDYLYHSFYIGYSRKPSSNPIINFSRDYSVNYTLKWTMTEELFSEFAVQYDKISEVQDDIGADPEKLEIISPSVKLGYKFAENLSSYVQYRYENRDSNASSDREYGRNIFTVGLNYGF